jgi:hypothetical protein
VSNTQRWIPLVDFSISSGSVASEGRAQPFFLKVKISTSYEEMPAPTHSGTQRRISQLGRKPLA